MDTKLLLLQAKKQQLDSYKPFRKELIKNLDEWFRIELTYTSNAIEGNTLTRQETALIVEEGITVQGKSLIEHQEAINHAQAWNFIHTLVNKTKNELSITDIRNIHNIILNKIDDSNKGSFRSVAVRLRGSETILPNSLKVPVLMTEFISCLQNNKSDHPVNIAIDAHFKLVSIHPFVDGNGRTARLLMNLLLMQNGYPPAIIRKEDRGRYIDSLEKGQTKNDKLDYYNLMYDAIDRSLDLYLEAVLPVKLNTQKLISEQRFYTTDDVAKLLQVDPESVRRYVRRGDLKAVKLGGKFIRIDKIDLNTFIENLKK